MTTILLHHRLVGRG